MEQLESSCEEVQFSREEVVWAKITGYPWWPALVTHAPEEPGPFRVDFFADNTHAFVSRSKLAKYQSLRAGVDLHKHMKKGLRRAIATADQAVRDRFAGLASLPESREAVEAVPPAQKQLLQLPFIETTPLQDPSQPHSHHRAHPLDHPPPPQTNQPLSDNQSESMQVPPSPQYSLERRRKYVSMLLRKYQLQNLSRGEEREVVRVVSRGREGRNARKRQATSRRERNKCKKISKTYPTHQQRPSTQTLLTRRLYAFLRGKSQLSDSQRRAITLSLSRQVQSHHPILQTAVEEVLKLLKWLQITPPSTIGAYYESWSSFQNEKEKASSMTTDD